MKMLKFLTLTNLDYEVKKELPEDILELIKTNPIIIDIVN